VKRVQNDSQIYWLSCLINHDPPLLYDYEYQQLSAHILILIDFRYNLDIWTMVPVQFQVAMTAKLAMTTQTDMKASIFDYHSEPSSPSVTPPLPPLSVSNSDYSSERSSPQISPQLPRSNSATHLPSTKTPDLVTSATRMSNGDKRIRRASGSQFTYRSGKNIDLLVFNANLISISAISWRSEKTKQTKNKKLNHGNNLHHKVLYLS
jgi:hypothetical protein